MPETQLDLFSASGTPLDDHSQPDLGRPKLVTAELDDEALIAAIPWASVAEAKALAAEAGRRRLGTAIPALAELCERFAGFGLERAVPEQVAALQALALIGGPESAQTVSRLIARQVVQGPTRKVAVGIAAHLEAALPAETTLTLLRAADPEVRADACRCTRPEVALVPALLDLTRDGDGKVRVAAFCALGRMGRREAGPALARSLRAAPSREVIDGVVRIADEDCIVLLGRIVRDQPALADAARDALEMIDHPRARQILAAVGAGETDGR